VSVATSGQTLVVTGATVGGSAVTLYSNAAATVPVALPATISADVTWYLAAGVSGLLVLASRWPSGVVLPPVSAQVRPGRPARVAPTPEPEQLAAAASLAGGAVTDGGSW
jgi:hypothetical protein